MFPTSVSSLQVLHHRPPPSPTIVVSDCYVIGERLRHQETFRVASENPQMRHESESTSFDQHIAPGPLYYDAQFPRPVLDPHDSLRTSSPRPRTRTRAHELPPPTLRNEPTSRPTARPSFPQPASSIGLVRARRRLAQTHRSTIGSCAPTFISRVHGRVQGRVCEGRVLALPEDLCPRFIAQELDLIEDPFRVLVQSFSVVRLSRQRHRFVDRIDHPSREPCRMPS